MLRERGVEPSADRDVGARVGHTPNTRREIEVQLSEAQHGPQAIPLVGALISERVEVIHAELLEGRRRVFDLLQVVQLDGDEAVEASLERAQAPGVLQGLGGSSGAAGSVDGDDGQHAQEERAPHGIHCPVR